MRGYFAAGVYNPKKEVNVGGVWRTAHSFGANHIFTIGKRYKTQSSDTTLAHKSIPLFEYLNFEEFYSHIPKDCRLIGLELDDRAKPIKNFVHPERSIYLAGAEENGLPKWVLDKCHYVIQLPGKYCLNLASAMSIALFDRIQKS